MAKSELDQKAEKQLKDLLQCIRCEEEADWVVTWSRNACECGIEQTMKFCSVCLHVEVTRYMDPGFTYVYVCRTCGDNPHILPNLISIETLNL